MNVACPPRLRTDLCEPFPGFSGGSREEHFSAAPEADWHLIGQFNKQDTMRTIPVGGGPFTVGRDAENSLCIPNPTVSSRHAELRVEAGRIVIRDLESRNGTFLNGHRLQEPTAASEGDVVQFGTAVFKLMCGSYELMNMTASHDVEDDAHALVQFNRMVFERAVVPHYQPIVDVETIRPVGYEVLGRSPLFGLESAAGMFRAAGQSRSEISLSESLRAEGVRAAAILPEEDELFLNTHPLEVGRARLLRSMAALRREWPDRPITLEIPEAAGERRVLWELQADLCVLDIGLACEGFSGEEDRLAGLLELRPDFVKFHMPLLRNIHRAPADRREAVAAAVRRLREAEVSPIALGIETQAEHDACREIGFELAQGYFYGKPVPATSLDARKRSEE